MLSWAAPAVPDLPGRAPALRLYDSSRRAVTQTDPGHRAGLYVCGITPYDATHLGHAATYLAFDLVVRAWRDAGHEVLYVQNATDVDDPLLDRAAATGEPWAALAAREIQLYREDMTALRVLPPDHYVGAVEAIGEIAPAVVELLDADAAYVLDDGTGDVYFAVASDPTFGEESGFDRDTMLRLFAERGGDPERAGKRDPLDSLLWRGARPGEPSWNPPATADRIGPGRPGWHIECTVIALDRLGVGFDVQGGGSDLIFPHHEHSAAHGQTLTGKHPFAHAYVHAGMIGLDGEKMSKSRGNLVFVSKLRQAGVDPMAIRLALLDGHYRADREWTGGRLPAAERRLIRWRTAVALPAGPPAAPLLTAVRGRLADDLDTVGAIADVDAWVDAALEGPGGRGTPGEGPSGIGEDAADPAAPALVRDLVDARLGIAL